MSPSIAVVRVVACAAFVGLGPALARAQATADTFTKADTFLASLGSM